MDPFLEGYLWPDVHNELASKIRRQLVPLLQPRYFAHLNVYLVEDDHPESEIGILYPDVEVMRDQSGSKAEEPTLPTGGAPPFSPASTSVAFPAPVEVRIPVVEIRNVKDDKLVTAIEILSPVNKKGSGLEKYRQKRIRLHRAGVHLLEIDLLRRGIRPFQSPHKKADYCVALTRAGNLRTDLWTISLRDPLPVVPVPLLPPDPDIPLDLQRALNEVYDEAGYQISVDYTSELPPPALSEADKAWLIELLTRR